MDKRDVALTIKLSKTDLEMLEKAAQRLWPGAMMSRSSMLLSLAKLGAKAPRKD